MPVAPIVPASEIEQAVALLQRGRVIVLPTDTVYGVAALPGNPEAVKRLFRARRAPVDTVIPVLIADLDDLTRVAAAVPPAARRLAERFWPGPLTLVLRRAPGFRGMGLANDDTVAVRIPAHEAARAIIRGVGGALAVTGANVEGSPPPTTAGDAAAGIGRGVALILDGGPCPGGVGSSIVDLSRTRPRLLREGAIPRKELTDAALVRIG